MKKHTWLILVSVWLLTLISVNQYFFCPQYQFKAPQPFSGTNVYNPYEGVDFSGWKKCNFHTHVKAWMGFTKGTSTSNAARKLYESLGYDVYCISNYQQVDRNNSDEPNYLEAYEHGYGILKNHQTVLGTPAVNWKDYLLPQSLVNKQHILAILRKIDSVVVIINHPSNMNSFPPGDFTFLSGYDGIEIFPSGSLAAFDSALSVGRPVFCAANDDSHDMNDSKFVGRNCTWLGASSVSKRDIMEALKSGRSYAMVVAYKEGESFEEKIGRIKKGLPSLRAVTVQNDSLKVTVSDSAAIQFIGQGGKVVAIKEKCTSASYPIRPGDTYVRTRIFFYDGNEIDLNPVFRYDGRIPENAIPPIDKQKTFLFNLAGIAILLAVSICSAIIFIRKRRRLRNS
ncbi:MAG: hypothetical protein ABIO98_02570 [Chitinophagales bacterium]